MNQTRVRYTHRTGQSQFQRCPRSNLLNQHWQGRGIELKAKSFEMMVGVYVHEGIALLLRGEQVDNVVSAVKAMIEVAPPQLMTFGCKQEQVMEEFEGLVEGVLRAWALARLPYFLSEYDVVEVEEDRCEKLVDTPQGEVWQEFKLDALLQQKDTGLYYVLSNKTTGAMDWRKQQDARNDMQGLSEIWGIEQALGIKVNGVVMEYLLTGKKEIEAGPEGNKWTQWSPLVRGWFNPNMPEDMQFAWRYDYTDENGARRRLGKGYNRIAARDIEGGIRAWIGSLFREEMFPRIGLTNPLASQFVSIDYHREQQDIDNWLEQIKEQERRVSEGLEEMARPGADERKVMNRFFPQFHHSCSYPGKCQFYDVCWGSAGLDPFVNGFDWRVPHHEKAREQQVQ